eukprot:3374772-Pyramimonas_sp.AAC.1
MRIYPRVLRPIGGRDDTGAVEPAGASVLRHDPQLVRLAPGDWPTHPQLVRLAPGDWPTQPQLVRLAP